MDPRLTEFDEACGESFSSTMMIKWQRIVDHITQISGAFVGLVMSISDDDLSVLVASQTDSNPFKVGDREHLLNSGLYCEAVIKTQEMVLVPYALESPVWDHNPDLKYDLVAYLGFPIKKPDGNPFGTICLLDNKRNPFSNAVITLLENVRDMIEGHLKVEHLCRINQKQNELLQERIGQIDLANQRLRQKEAQYRLITENISDVIWVLNLGQRKFTYISPSILQLRGLTVEEAMAEKLEDSMTPESLHLVNQLITKSIDDFIKDRKQSVLFSTEVRQPTKSGDIIWIEVTTKYVVNPQGEIEIIGVSRNIEDRKKKEQEIYHLSTHDYLTGTYNRAFFEHRFAAELQRVERYDCPFSLMIIDLDYFKQINDTYGHRTGDAVLHDVAANIATNIRAVDLLARYGGEEFIILLPETNQTGALQAAEHIRSQIESKRYTTNQIQVTASIGVAMHQQGDSLDDLYQIADHALYTAKAKGRNQIVLASCR